MASQRHQTSSQQYGKIIAHLGCKVVYLKSKGNSLMGIGEGLGMRVEIRRSYRESQGDFRAMSAGEPLACLQTNHGLPGVGVVRKKG